MSANNLPFDPHTVKLGTSLTDGKTAIHIAAERGNIEAMQILLDRGERFGLRSFWDNQNVLHLAAMHDLDAVCSFVLRHAKAHSTLTCTHSASSCERNFNCLIRSLDFDLNSPLSSAIKHGHVSTAAILMQFKSSTVMNGRNEYESIDCYKTAIKHKQSPALRFLLRCERPNQSHLDSLVQTAISENNTEMVAELLRFGADPTKKFALQPAAKFGNVEMMKLLINYGIGINTVSIGDSISWPPLLCACLSNNDAAVRYALKCGAFPDVRDDKNHLAFEYTGAGLMTFAELGISFSTLQMDHISRWPDLEKKLEMWIELDLFIDLATKEKDGFLDIFLLRSNQRYNHFRMSNSLSKLAFRFFMGCGADLETLAPTKLDRDLEWKNKKSHALLHCSLDSFSFDEEATKAILARFVEPHAVEKKMDKLVVKYVHPSFLHTTLVKAIIAFNHGDEKERKATTTLIRFLITKCGIDATEGLISCNAFSTGWTADTIRLLINEFGAAPNAAVTGDCLPGIKRVPFLHLVCLQHDIGAVKAMLECGAKVNQVDSKGNNELMRLVLDGYHCSHGRDCQKNKLKIAKLLLEAGSSTDMKNHAGQTVVSMIDTDFEFASFKRPLMEYMSEAHKT